MLNILTVDVEENYHATEVQDSAGADAPRPSRVEPQTRAVLDLLDRRGIRATFFILGEVARAHPALLQEIAARGHETGCHSYAHQLVYRLTPEEFRADTRDAAAAIADACGALPRIYRAPSYSITGKSLWALEILVELGFTHDSSIYPIAHDRYGIPGFERHAHVLETPSGPILEVPIATVKLDNNKVTPVGGGGYLRLLPYRYTAAGIRRLNRLEQQPACIYFHPWELDPEQPQAARGALARLRTYAGLRGMRSKVERLADDFRFGTLTEVHPFAAGAAV
jgi:polysaccharide deacetylase family protein (PEP-CTERM system associated)